MSKDEEDKPPRTRDSGRPKVYIVGGGFEYIRLMYNLGCDGATGLDDADMVLFTGGEDVNPELYGEVPLAKTYFNRPRDDKEIAIYRGALDRELPMVGICRGGQFLNVMNGGKLWQHVTMHAGRDHIARIEVAPYVGKKKQRRTISVTSTHHQMMIPAKHGMVLLTALEALEKDSPAYTKIGKNEEEPDTEAVFYDDTNCLCFQPHPEFGYAKPELVDFFEECLDNFIYPMIPLKDEMLKAILAQTFDLTGPKTKVKEPAAKKATVKKEKN
jgi:gamma-glutamyl-gamma-aminobutyrate hydrolase PuuD